MKEHFLEDLYATGQMNYNTEQLRNVNMQSEQTE